jgi:hypothetical protein
MSKEVFSSLILIFASLGVISSGGFAAQTQEPGQTKITQKKNQPASSVPWTKFAPKEAGFSILFPSAPTEKVDSFQHESVSIPTHTYNLENGELTYFVVRVGDVPESSHSTTLIDGIFNNADKMFFGYTTKEGKEEMTKITNQREFSLGSYPGRHYESDCGPYKATSTGACGVILRVYKTSRSIYVVGLSGSKTAFTEDRANRFFDSFSIIP